MLLLLHGLLGLGETWWLLLLLLHGLLGLGRAGCS